MLSYRVFEAKRRPQLSEIALGFIAIILALKSDYLATRWQINNLDYAAEWNAGIALVKTVGFLLLMNVAVRVKPIMSHAKTSFLGSLSYPLYLLHSMIGFVLFHHLNGAVNRWMALALVYALILGIAFGVAKFVEPKGRSAVLYLSGRLLEGIGRLTKRRLQPDQMPQIVRT
jgi:peptidoglycan/LPS O-acetylase OafA/YrhL